jgi:hypothetical protein
VVSLPWYLLSAGIGLVILGFLLAGLPGKSERGRRSIHSRMRDDEIIRNLKRAERIPFSSLVILAGLGCVLVSIGWRLARAFL